MCFSLKTLRSIIRTGYPILVELIDLVELCYNFSISYDLIQIFKFPTQIPDQGFPTGVKMGGGAGGLSQYMGGRLPRKGEILLLLLTRKNICNLIG